MASSHEFGMAFENHHEVVRMTSKRRAGVRIRAARNMTEVVRTAVTGWLTMDLTIEGTDFASTLTSVPDGNSSPYVIEVQACVLPGTGKVECSGNVSAVMPGEVERAREWVVAHEEKLFLQVKLGKPVVKVVDLKAMRVTLSHADADEYEHNGEIPSGGLDLFVNFTRHATRKDDFYYTASLIQVFVALMTGLRLPKRQLALASRPYPDTGHLEQGYDIYLGDVTRCRDLGIQRLGIPANQYDIASGWEGIRTEFAGDMQIIRIGTMYDAIELSFCTS